MQRILTTTLVLTLALPTLGHAQSLATEPVAPVATSISRSYGPPTVGTSMAFTLPGRSETMPAVLIVPSSELPGERASELAEDLNVMCALFDKLLGDAGVKTRSWGSRSGRYKRSTRCVHLPGFGSLFLVEVDFPLAAPPEAQSEESDAPSQDALWAEVRSNMRSPSTRGAYRNNQILLQYDTLKVESLKRTLQRAIKHASNVRHLGSDEQIVAVAIESPKSPNVIRNIQIDSRYSQYRVVSPASQSPKSTNIVSIRSSKKEVDALAKGQIDAATFDANAEILSYPLPFLGDDGRSTETVPRLR